MSEPLGDDVLDLVRNAFACAHIPLVSSNVRRFPGETIVVVEVNPNHFANALAIASDLDSKISDGFVTVRKAAQEAPKALRERAQSLLDPRVNNLIELLNARSRTSEQQPSLRYIPDATQNLNVAASRRHHLIFGRRGVGKTALMLEAKKLLETRGAMTFWTNIQTMRSLSAQEAFLTTASRLCDVPQSAHLGRSKAPLSIQRAAESKS